MNKRTLYILDLDRTLIDVSEVMGVTRSVCWELKIDFNQIYKEQQNLSSRGTAYSPFKYIASHSNIDIEKFKNRFIELSSNDKLFFSDSREFIEKLKSRKFDYMLLTHGVDEEWQRLKIKAAHLDKIPYLIVKDRYKGRLINSWVNPEDDSLEPEVDNLGVYTGSVFVDDREEAFLDIPDSCRGYILDRDSKFSNGANIPDNVTVIRSLNEVE